MTNQQSESHADDVKLDPAKIDDAVAALLYLNASFEKVGPYEIARAWKSLNLDALDRLHAAGLISEPRSKAKSACCVRKRPASGSSGGHDRNR